MSSADAYGGPRPAVVLHVGMGRTGTTSLQASLHRNRRLLATRGILYPKSPGKRRHIRFGLAVQVDDGRPRVSGDWQSQRESSPAELRPVVLERLMQELSASSATTMVLSDEALLVSEPATLRNLREMLDQFAATVRVVAYLRRQDDHVSSRYQQVVKRAGEVRRFPERVAALDLSRVYDYPARLAAWRDLVRPDELVVRPFERDEFPHGSLLEDFVEAAGLEVQAQDLRPVPAKNESLDAEALEFMRLLNLLRHEHDVGPDADTRSRVVRALERASTGPTLTLPEADLDRFMGQWAEGNREVAREFLGRPDGELFRTPRKTTGTTTEQRLEPARVEELAERLDLPVDLREPLRHLAEREAAYA